MRYEAERAPFVEGSNLAAADASRENDGRSGG
jgi:hypothetical protein